MSLTKEQCAKFDYLNRFSYLFRLQIERNGLGITARSIGGDDAYFVIYNNHVIGVLVIGEQYVNFTLYKYLKKIFPKLDDFRMSEYFDSSITHFLFDKFDEYVTSIKLALDTLPANVNATNDAEHGLNTMADVKARLMEFLVSDDITDSFLDSDSLPMNVLRHDISMALAEIHRLESDLQAINEKVTKLFLSL